MKPHLVGLALALITGVNPGSHALAGQEPRVSLRGRGFTDACEYYSRTESEFEALFRDEGLAWGSKVFFIFGFGDADTDWQDRTEIEATAVGPFLWKADLSKTLHFRSSSKRLRSLQMVVRVVHPEGFESYFRGSDSLLGFMNAELPFVGSSPCLTREMKKPEMVRLPVRSVSRG